MAYGTRAAFLPLREIDSASIGASFVPFGAPLTDNIRLVTFQNRTDADVYISTDEIDNHLRIPSNSFKLLDISANKVRDDGLFFAAGTQFFIKEVSGTPTTGDAWMEFIVAEGGK